MNKYFDNSATTFVSDEVINKICDVLKNTNGNPSSLHKLGLSAELEIKSATEKLATLINCTEQEIIFTSGGTESNNLAIQGVAKALAKRGNKIITSSAEHSSVHDCVKHLSENGFDCVFVKPQRDGQINIDDILNQIDDKTILISLMLSNNETGAVNEIKRLVTKAKKISPKVIIHCDGVSSLGKMRINTKDLDVDLMSFSAHKIHGPKGIGALYIKKGVRILPIIFGGAQQNKIRPGTQNVPFIAGFGVACETTLKNLSSNIKHATELNNILYGCLKENDLITFNSKCLELCDSKNINPFVMNISTNAVKSEIMMHFLEEKNFFVSSGSACSKGAKSRVLSQCGLSDKEIDSALRISFCEHNTQDDVKQLASEILCGINALKSNY